MHTVSIETNVDAGVVVQDNTLLNFINEMSPEALTDFRSFVSVANNLKRLAKTCNPRLVREATKLERFKRTAVESIRRDWLERKIMGDSAARKAIDYVYRLYNDAIDDAEHQLDVCFR